MYISLTVRIRRKVPLAVRGLGGSPEDFFTSGFVDGAVFVAGGDFPA